MAVSIYRRDAYTRLPVLIRPLILIGLAILFFFYYNTFLVDKSLELLRTSLAKVNASDTANSLSYLGPLMGSQLASELSAARLDVKKVLNLQYTTDVVSSPRPERDIKDVVSVMNEIIMEGESKRGRLLQFFDKLNNAVKKIIGRFTGTAYRGVVGTKGDIDAAILVEINNSENSGDFEHAIALYRNTIDRFPNYNQTSALILRLGYLLHRLGKFKEAEESYKYLVDKFPDSPETSIAKGLIRKIAELESEKKRSAGVISKIAVVKDKLSEQSLYYDLGLSKFSSFNLIYAKENFKKAISAIPDNTIAAKSYFYLGLCERLLGNLTESINALEEAYKLAGDNQDLKMESKYQTVQIYKQKGDYNKAAAILEEVIRDYKNKTVRPILLFQEGATLLFDLGDTAKAKQAFETLRIEYPAQTIVYPGSYFVDKYIKMDIPPKKPEEIEKIAEKTKLLDAVLPKRAIEIIQTAAKDFTAKVNNRISELILLKEKYKGVIQDEATIKIRQSLLNNYIQEWFPPGSKGKVWDISVRYDGDERITAFGAIYLEGATPMDVFISGRLKIVEWINQPYWEAGDKRSNWVIFLPTQCKIKGIPISPDLINLILKPATEEFNKNFPLQIKKFGFNKETMEFVGDVKSDIVKKFKATSYSRGSTG